MGENASSKKSFLIALFFCRFFRWKNKSFFRKDFWVHVLNHHTHLRKCRTVANLLNFDALSIVAVNTGWRSVTLLENLTADAKALLYMTISLYFTKLFVT